MKQNNFVVGIVIGVVSVAFVYQVYTVYTFQKASMEHKQVISNLKDTVEQIEQILIQAVQPQGVPRASVESPERIDTGMEPVFEIDEDEMRIDEYED